jgi:hypothetical protein
MTINNVCSSEIGLQIVLCLVVDKIRKCGTVESVSPRWIAVSRQLANEIPEIRDLSLVEIRYGCEIYDYRQIKQEVMLSWK